MRSKRTKAAGSLLGLVALIGCSTPSSSAPQVVPVKSEASTTAPSDHQAADATPEPSGAGAEPSPSAAALSPSADEETNAARPSEAEASPASTETVMLTLPGSNLPAGKPRGPHYMEVTSSLIAVARMGRTVGRGSKARTSLKIERVLVGAVKGKTITAPDELPNFGCIPPNEPFTASSLHKEGTQVVVYVNQSQEGGFRLRHIERVMPQGLSPWLLRYGELRQALLRGASEDEFARLLKKESWEAGTAAIYALNGSTITYGILGAPAPAVGRIVLKQLEQCSRRKDENYRQLSGRLATMLSVIPATERHKGLLPVLGCMKGYPEGYVTEVKPNECIGGSSDPDCCRWKCHDTPSMLDGILHTCLTGASKKERSAVATYAARRAKAGVVVAIE